MCQALPHLAILRKDGTIAAYDGLALLNRHGVNAFTSLLNSEGGFIKTYAPLKVTFDYYGFLKDKYKKDLDKAEEEETKNNWDEIPIKSKLKHSAMSGYFPEEPEEHPFDIKAFTISKPLAKAPINYEDMVIPTIVNQQRKMVGNYEEPKYGGLVVTSDDINKQDDPNRFQ